MCKKVPVKKGGAVPVEEFVVVVVVVGLFFFTSPRRKELAKSQPNTSEELEVETLHSMP